MEAGTERSRNLFEALNDWLLGERIAVPPELARQAGEEEITLRRGRLLPWLGGTLARLDAPAAAVTLRRTIVLHPDAPLTPALLAHECEHVRQWDRDPLFPLRYAAATLRHGYRNNPFEVEARQAAALPRTASAPRKKPDAHG